MYVWGITWFVWHSCSIMYGFSDCELCTFFPLFRHSRTQYDKFEICFACMMTVWVVCGDRGLALYVTLCPNNARHNKNLCCQVLVCLQYCWICFTDNCSFITIDYLRMLVYQMRPVVNHFFCFFWCLPGAKSNRKGSKWHEFSRNQQST